MRQGGARDLSLGFSSIFNSFPAICTLERYHISYKKIKKTILSTRFYFINY